MQLTVSSDEAGAPDGADWGPGTLEARLVNAALARLETVSAEQLSMRKLAAEIGVSHQAPYTHFRSRTRFLAAVAGAGLATVAAEAREAVAQAGADPLEQMLALADHYVTFIERQPHLFDLAYGPSIQMRDHRALQTAAIAYWRLLREVVGACQPVDVSDGEIQNRCEIAASTVYGIARMGAHHKIPRLVQATPRELVAAALRTLNVGWNPPNQPVHSDDADD
ncbi:TetR/AcrR family transcriptional regulator [Microbacterium pumilum]|uniref:HTH tetR-type domain-containing protein n=1 Tax=Microbacterium pumilum TaxID=344165 RepID=A0ABP5D526_9MICO